MAPGAFDVPVPVGGAELVPDALLVPPVGIGPLGDRLGYGGGFFDRTLAALEPRPVTVAHAFELSRVATTHPQPHDICMDVVVTEAGVEVLTGGRLAPSSARDARARIAAIAQARRLPRSRTG